MSRKQKTRSQPPSGAAVASPPAPPRELPSSSSASKPAPKTWLETVGRQVMQALGSLQLAVILLSIFVLVLIVGTMLESWYSAELAQELVYHAWWFSLLLFLLGVNIFFAAVKKWPWKKYQTGFLITHLGLLVMLTGGIVTSISHTDATLVLIDTSNPAVTEDPRVLDNIGLLRQSGSTIALRDDADIVIKEYKLKRPTEGGRAEPYVAAETKFRFAPGSFVWKTEPDDYGYPKMHPLVAFFGALAHPLPRHWEADLGDGARLRVIAFYPNVKPKRGNVPRDDIHAGVNRRTDYEPDLDIPIGMTRDGLKPAARCRLSLGKDHVDFWLPQNATTTQHVGQRVFTIEYAQRIDKLPFELKLLRAEMTTDKGTQSAASYTSWVQLTDPEKGIFEKDYMITMNEPLEYRGFKVYQSTYGSITQSLGITDPANGRPVSYSGFTVGRDPGLWLKYLGSIMLALGIATMFYMRAYFFKPRVKHPDAGASSAAASASGST